MVVSEADEVKSNNKKLYHWGEQSVVITCISTGLLLEHWGENERALSFLFLQQGAGHRKNLCSFFIHGVSGKTARSTAVLGEFWDDLS